MPGPAPGAGCNAGHHWFRKKARLANGKTLWKCKFCPKTVIK